jgi:ABC-type sugar transport system substrate-binding protein
MSIRKSLAAALSAACLLAIAAPVAGAATEPQTVTFVPPRVGPLSVDIAPTVINGTMTDPGMHVTTPGVTPPPISWTMPPTIMTPQS